MKTTKQYISILQSELAVTRYSVLIPADDLDAILSEITAALLPCDRPIAAKEAKRLASCYPTFRATKEWVFHVEEVLKSAPCDLIIKAISRLSVSHTFPPNKAQVQAVLDQLIANRKAVRARAQAMKREHIRRGKLDAAEADRNAARKSFSDKLAGRTPLEMFKEESK